MPASEMQEQMKRLRKAEGVDFDLEFTRIMPQHHQGAITMSRDALKHASHDKIRRFATKLIAKQTNEGEQFAKLHKEWRASGR